ncbi:MAG TPA: hypothetical protein PKA30_10715 [Accumulibacter sp.]|uniref:GT99 family glycosyltransferase N-terminal domain-containing protein n=1 Tax=Accumulibacter sp. TaxID=2053492 RepID=UPI0026395627|nr:hypothetical protein [Accumulibacter sp.]MDS4056170.1 hypothetical protein [Accumulibacter sp.]HMV06007.1 hypothetical protein [Accumulibacter sp.]HMW63746.1 hypothetical protein [Accumulibacter sp.]HMX68434.1 hypothetical protein [Accumulibacter sp.]HNB68038.1 hypothetical protein [Accumulibacter sp.]
MFLSYLLPFPARGQPALYLWVLYKQIAHFTPQEIAFIGSAAYFRSPEEYQRSARRDISTESQEIYGFRIPAQAELDLYTRYVMPDDVFFDWQALEPTADGVMRRILSERCPQFESALRRVLDESTCEYEVEAVLTWCNMPSLSAVAAEYGLPVVHGELGPLRGPCYHWTAYFDRSGVNGNTESAQRYERFLRETDSADVPVLGTQELRDLLVVTRSVAAPASGHDFEMGVALQVENDSNIIAYANGWSNERLIAAVASAYGDNNILVRKHPGGLHDYGQVCANVDQSANSIEFIRRCAGIATINSSVGLEALLFDRHSIILGDSPFRFAAQGHLGAAPANRTSADHLRALNFLLFGYLVPYEFVFDPGYLRWRLSEPSELAIYQFHLDYVRQRRHCIDDGARFRPLGLGLTERGLMSFWQSKTHSMCYRIAALRLQLDEMSERHAVVERTLGNTLASWSWRLTAPLRWIHRRSQWRTRRRTPRSCP